jgi:hypothetical protein
MAALSPSALCFATSTPTDTILPPLIGLGSLLHAIDEIELSKIGRTQRLLLLSRDSKTWNPIADNLEPDVPEFRFEDQGWRIRSYYPSGLKFIVGPFQPATNVQRTSSIEARIGPQ